MTCTVLVIKDPSQLSWEETIYKTSNYVMMRAKMMRWNSFTSFHGFDFDPLINVTKEEEEEIPTESSLLPGRERG